MLAPYYPLLHLLDGRKARAATQVYLHLTIFISLQAPEVVHPQARRSYAIFSHPLPTYPLPNRNILLFPLQNLYSHQKPTPLQG